MKQLLLIVGKYFAIEWENCTFAFYVDFQSRKICQFLNKGGIMSHIKQRTWSLTQFPGDVNQVTEPGDQGTRTGGNLWNRTISSDLKTLRIVTGPICRVWGQGWAGETG